jgi:hypothetical protein
MVVDEGLVIILLLFIALESREANTRETKIMGKVNN